MPSSAVHTFTDPDEFASSARATTAEMTVTRRGQFSAKLTRIDLHRLWMQRLSSKLPAIVHSALVSGRVVISFRMHAGPRLVWGGIEMHPTTILRHSDGEAGFERSAGSASWGAMWLPVEHAAGCRGNICKIRPWAAPQRATDHSCTATNGEIAEVARGGRALGGGRSRNHRTPGGSAWA